LPGNTYAIQPEVTTSTSDYVRVCYVATSLMLQFKVSIKESQLPLIPFGSPCQLVTSAIA